MNWTTWLPFILIVGLLVFCVGPMLLMGGHSKNHNSGKDTTADSKPTAEREPK